MDLHQSDSGFGIGVDAQFGFRHLDPIPSPEFLAKFYTERYMELVGAGGRAPELRRLLDGGTDREAELAWLHESLYSDVDDALSRGLGGIRGRLVDLGAGTGDFVAFALERGWQAEGIEPSKLAAERATERGLTVVAGTLETYVAERPSVLGTCDAVSMLNVLEHVPDPVAFLGDTCTLLRPGTGVLCLSVPNDFTDLQAAVVAASGAPQWWVAIPDHINYFDFESLSRTLEGCGFEVLERTGTFPMELLVLLGIDYISNPALGGDAHRRRVAFEAALSAEVRRRLYRSLARAGFGRNCVILARRLADERCESRDYS